MTGVGPRILAPEPAGNSQPTGLGPHDEIACKCGHPVFSHDNLGCNRRIGHCDICPCAVDVAQLAANLEQEGS